MQGFIANAQTILETNNIQDSTNTVKLHSTKKATIMSAFVPGLGQAYNKKYWKIPIIWGLYGGTIYGIHFNQQNYLEYKEIYKKYLANDSYTVELYGLGKKEALESVKDYYKRNRDLMFILTVGLHVLNILDANVDAHFFTFDISNDISLRAEPVLFDSFSVNKSTNFGLKLSINF